nr:systemin receptor SR160-like [Ipomoea batatas]
MLHPHHHALMLFFIILLFSSLNYSQSLTTHADDERAILLSLKRHWGNPSSLHHWNSTFSPCDDWPEISCNSNGSVTWIYLSGRNLQGSFPSKIICQLNSLSSIDFSYNSLWGSIPVGLSSCSKLEDLDLSENNFTGKIPGELFSMKRLRNLYLQYNMLSGEIPTIPMMAHSLEYLDLSSNHLNGSIPEDIGNLYNLVHLDLSLNSLTGPIPDRLSQLHQLFHLSLSFNKMTGEIPGKLELFSLNHIDLSHNHLSGSIPRGFGELLNLEYINVSHNHLSGDMQLKERFEYSFFDGANLCSDVKENGLPACSTDWCSDYIACSSKPSSKSKKKSDYISLSCGAIAISLSCGAIAARVLGILILVGLMLGILILVFRPTVGRKKESDGEEWKYGSTRKVDAKSDIYSFGVVLLELTTGREAVTGNEDINLAQWAHKHQREGKSAADALDEEIKDPHYLEAMITVFKLGLACTLSSPSSRPSMKDISQILQRCSENSHMSPES